MNRFKRTSAILSAALLLAVTGCATERKAAGEYFDDAGITTRVKKAIYDEPSLKVTQIGVTTEDNVVHLTGTVKTRAEAAKAAAVARRVNGVKGVRNDLHLKP